VFKRLTAEIVVICAIAGWWLTSRTLPEAVFPSPFFVAQELFSLLISAQFWLDAGISASRIVAAVVLATLAGTVIGLLPRYVPVSRGIVEDVLVPFFGSFPGLAWAILGTVWFGITPTAILIIQMLIIVPFCMVNVVEGTKEIGFDEVEMARSFGRSRMSIFWRIELPLISPFIMASVRIAYGICWKISLIAELFGARSGLGHMMHTAQELGQVNTIIAICLTAFQICGLYDESHEQSSNKAPVEGTGFCKRYRRDADRGVRAGPEFSRWY
jgi:ABC-type nitrate/sulfonate/bicarbonate transport system permease component